MSIFDKIKIPTAVEHRNTFDLSCDHVTTMNFMQPKVIYSKEIVPKESTQVKVETLTRLSPLLAPTFMRSSIKTRAFFVPFRTVWRPWNSFITSTSTPTGTFVTTVPQIYNQNILVALIDSNYSSVVTGNDPYDFVYENTTTTPISYTKYKFTSKGRIIHDVLIGLGYRVLFTDDSSKQFFSSALPLLCFYKVICDWYYYNQYMQYNYSDQLRESIGYSSNFSYNDLLGIFSNISNFVCQYDNDYFTSAFTNAMGPSVNTSNFTIPNLVSGSSSVTSGSGNSTISGTINQYAIDALKSLSDYLKRHQLSGSQVIDRFASRFGVKLDSAKIEKSIYLGTDQVNLQIGEVFNNTYAANTVLGEYAGKGIGYGNTGKFSVSSDEFGFLIILSNIVPHVGYGQGVKRQVMRITPLDYFTPEFDSLGNQAIAMKEISLPYDVQVSNNWLSNSSSRKPNDVFGYTPRYSDYKSQQDFISGNYIYNSTNVGEDAWYGNRLFRDGVNDTLQAGRMIGDTTAGTSMLQAKDAQQYDRIFADDSSSLTEGNDHFRSIFHIDVKASLPMSPLVDTHNFEQKGKEYLAELGGSSLHN